MLHLELKIMLYDNKSNVIFTTAQNCTFCV